MFGKCFKVSIELCFGIYGTIVSKNTLNLVIDPPAIVRKLCCGCESKEINCGPLGLRG